jgi:hypothetical protein
MPPGFPGLRCPKCGDTEALIIEIETLDLRCCACVEAIARKDIAWADLAASSNQWRRLLEWLDTAGSIVSWAPR